MQKERTKLLGSLDRAMQVYINNPTIDNEDAINAVYDDIFEFNMKNPFISITSDTIQKSLEGRAESRAGAFQGLIVDPKLAPLVYPLIESSRTR